MLWLWADSAGKKRLQSLTIKELSALARSRCQVGGLVRAEKLTSKQRSEIARKAAKAR